MSWFVQWAVCWLLFCTFVGVLFCAATLQEIIDELRKQGCR